MDNNFGNRPSERLLFEAAALDHGIGQISRVGPSLARLQEARAGTKMSAMDSGKTLIPYVTLSPRQPWVDERGWLEALNVRSLFASSSFASSPNIAWMSAPGQPRGFLDIWLEGLEPNATYFAQMEVSSMGTGKFVVDAVALGAAQFVKCTQAHGGYQSLLSRFETVDGGLAKINVFNTDWIFFEVIVSKLE
jgi:hypothetical protein